MELKQVYQEIKLISLELQRIGIRQVDRHKQEFVLLNRLHQSDFINESFVMYVARLLKDIRSLREQIKPERSNNLSFVGRLADLQYDLQKQAKNRFFGSWRQRSDFRSFIDDNIRWTGSLYCIGRQTGSISVDKKVIIRAKRIGVDKATSFEIFTIRYVLQNTNVRDGFLALKGKHCAIGKTQKAAISNLKKEIRRLVSNSLES